MLTGDNEQIASQIATKLNLQEYKASLLPQQKVEEVENLLKKYSFYGTLRGCSHKKNIYSKIYILIHNGREDRI